MPQSTARQPRSGRRPGHAQRRRRGRADRSARRADLLAQSICCGRARCRSAGWSCALRSWCRARPPASCCATTTTARSSARRRSLSRRGLHRRRRSRKAALPAWEKAGFELFSGVNVPSKAFGEHIEHDQPHAERLARRAQQPDQERHRHGGGRQPAVRRVPARLDPDRDQRAGRRAGAAHPRHRAVRPRPWWW